MFLKKTKIKIWKNYKENKEIWKKLERLAGESNQISYNWIIQFFLFWTCLIPHPICCRVSDRFYQAREIKTQIYSNKHVTIYSCIICNIFYRCKVLDWQYSMNQTKKFSCKRKNKDNFVVINNTTIWDCMRKSSLRFHFSLISDLEINSCIHMVMTHDFWQI